MTVPLWDSVPAAAVLKHLILNKPSVTAEQRWWSCCSKNHPEIRDFTPPSMAFWWHHPWGAALLPELGVLTSLKGYFSELCGDCKLFRASTVLSSARTCSEGSSGGTDSQRSMVCHSAQMSQPQYLNFSFKKSPTETNTPCELWAAQACRKIQTFPISHLSLDTFSVCRSHQLSVCFLKRGKNRAGRKSALHSSNKT